jgi:hypothetical protein
MLAPKQNAAELTSREKTEGNYGRKIEACRAIRGLGELSCTSRTRAGCSAALHM